MMAKVLVSLEFEMVYVMLYCGWYSFADHHTYVADQSSQTLRCGGHIVCEQRSGNDEVVLIPVNCEEKEGVATLCIDMLIGLVS